MKKLIKSKGTEFEQNGKDLVLIDTDQRGGKPIMLDSADLNRGFENAETVVVQATDPDLIPENIKEGVEILGVTGTFAGGQKVNPITNAQYLFYQGARTENIDFLMSSISEDCTNFTLAFYGVGYWDGKYNLEDGNEIRISNLNIQNATTLSSAFEMYTNKDDTEFNFKDQTLSNCTILSSMFRTCSYVKHIVMPKFTKTGLNITYLFQNCTSLEIIDLRNITLTTQISSYPTTAMQGVPTTCNIIVSSDEDKTQWQSKFATWSKVYTVDEAIAAEIITE